MAKFKTEEDVLNETKEDKTVRCPVCKNVFFDLPVNIYVEDGKTIEVCRVIKCLKCGEIKTFFTYGKNGRPDFSCKNINIPEGLSFMAIKMFLWKNKRHSTNLVYDEILKGE